MKQLDLYPDSPGFADVDTSREAANRMKPTAARLRSMVQQYIAAQGIIGATCDEVEQALELRHQTASARCRELELRGEIRKTTTRRKTRSGRTARVYVVRANNGGRG